MWFLVTNKKYRNRNDRNPRNRKVKTVKDTVVKEYDRI
jgi:hypothetical protein